MITIGQPRIEENAGKTRLICDIGEDGIEQEIWFEVDNEYARHLCHERSDAYLIGLLSHAMLNKHDITCTAPVTEELLYNIQTHLMPSLVKHGKTFHRVNIHARTTSEPIGERTGVGTGISCGIDSFHAVLSHYDNDQFPDFKLTHLCINNVGAFNECYESAGIDLVKQQCYERSRKVAHELGLPLIETDSNFQQAIPQSHSQTHTYSSLFAVFCLQKLWKTYLYASSGYDYSAFSLNNHDQQDPSVYELLSLNCFSTKQLKIYSEGGAKDRFEKTEFIVSHPTVHRHLHVCIHKSTNCGDCHKCKRTLLTLDALDKLDLFRESFDIAAYRDNKTMYYIWLYGQHKAGNKMVAPIYKKLAESVKMKGFVYSIGKRAYHMQIIARKIKSLLTR